MDGKYSGIIHLYFLKIKGSDIFSLLNPGSDGKIKFGREALPHYVIGGNGKFENSEMYFQFFYCDDKESKEKEYVFIDYVCADYVLAEILSNCGLDELFNNCEFLPLDYSKINLNKWDTLEIPIPTLFKITQTYYSSFNGESTEYDTEEEIKYFSF